MQILDGPEPVMQQDEMALFVQQWKPSLYEFGPMTEVIVGVAADVPQLKAKVGGRTVRYFLVKEL